jgi:formylglycine-generating enzyme required for sulfatase activity
MSSYFKRTAPAFTFLSLALCYASANADSFGSGENSFKIDFVTVDNPGNAPDTTWMSNPAGSVSYTYRIGKYEVSRGMIENANRKGGLGITLADMTKHGGNGSRQPATGVSWFEAAQFVNYLNTCTGSMPAYKFDENSDYQLWQPEDLGYDHTNLYRNSLASYFLPSDDEWYKAAFYAPNLNVFYKYPTGDNLVPDGIDFPGDTTFDAVFDDGPHNVLYVNRITDVGLLSPYGTAGQGGNVWEWEEIAHDFMNDSISSVRGGRGGGASNGPHYMRSRLANPPDKEAGRLGFRVASKIPEPSTQFIATLATAVLSMRRWSYR